MKKMKIAFLVFAGILCVVVGGAVWGQGVDSLPQDPVERGIAIAPVRLNLEGRNRTLVGLGSYLVNARSACLGCHTTPQYAPGGDPYMGQPLRINTTNYMAGGARFGPFVSRNLTPDLKSGRPADLTFEEFIRSVRTGEDVKKLHPQMGPILQVMPWPEFGRMNDFDLRAIYEYLSVIPHAEPAP